MEAVSFGWRNVSVSTEAACRTKSRPILHDVSGYVGRGELLAVMGPSAAGKTTLLNALAFQNLGGLAVTSGLRVANGVHVTPTMMSALCGYIPQEDLFIGTLTVREHLTFMSNLRLGKATSAEQKRARVQQVMHELGLTKCADTLIGIRGRIKGISGGEMRRLSFASEYLADPPLLLADEPTSGLDSWMAENMIKLMRSMCERGRTIVCVIHQPSSEVYHLFDRLLLMVEGKVAFMGGIEEATLHFDNIGFPCPKHFSPSDHYINSLSMAPRQESEYESRIARICEDFRTSTYASLVLEEISSLEKDREAASGEAPSFTTASRYKAPWRDQFRAVLWRSWHSVIKEPKIAGVRILEVIILSLLVGTLYFGQDYGQDSIVSINGAMYWVTLNQSYSTYTNIMTVFCQEIPIFLREHSIGMYRTEVYYLAKQLADLPLLLVTPTVFMIIIYPMANLKDGVVHCLIAIAIIILLVQAAVSMAYFSACVAPNLSVALAVGPTALIPFTIIGGFYINQGTVPAWLSWIKYVSPWFYANEALNINQWTNVTLECDTADESNCLTTGEEVLDFYSYNPDNMAFDLCMLVVLGLAFRTMGIVALAYRARTKSN